MCFASCCVGMFQKGDDDISDLPIEEALSKNLAPLTKISHILLSLLSYLHAVRYAVCSMQILLSFPQWLLGGCSC